MRVINRVLSGGFLLASLSLPTYASTVSSEVEATGGRMEVTLANPFEQLIFVPAEGGRCISFRLLDKNEQLVEKGGLHGFFIDHWATFTWPSGLMHLPYQYQIVGDGKTTVGIKLWTTVPSMGGGRGDADSKTSLTIPTSPDLIGLIVQKTIMLHADRDVIDVDEEVINPLSESRGVALYLQHNFNMNDSLYHNIWYLPSTRGVDLRIMPDKEGDPIKGVDWVRDPTAGWIAVRDHTTDRGLLFAFDYNYLDRLYTSGSTAEWFMDTTSIAPGKSFKTSYVIKPIRDFEGVVYGSKRIVADLRPHEEGGEVHVINDLAAVSGELTSLEVESTVTGWKSKVELARQSFRLEKLTEAKTRQEFNFSSKDVTDGVVIRIKVSGPGWEERYETYYDGDKKAQERQINLWATKGGALPGTQGDAYFQKQPRKIKSIDKPDLGQVPRPSLDHFKCLVIFGLYTHILNLDDALAEWKAGGKLLVEFTFLNCPPNAVEGFPSTYNELFSYNVVVLSDVNYKAIGDVGFEMLCDYVEQGGCLLVTGGPYAFGDGEFEDTRFLDVLPVKLSGPFDLKRAGTGKSWPLAANEGKSMVLEGLTFNPSPRVFWQHFVTPKPGAEVILSAEGHPSVVLGHYGKGKVAAILLSPTGEASPGETAWWDWKGWPQLVQNLFNWFIKK